MRRRWAIRPPLAYQGADWACPVSVGNGRPRLARCNGRQKRSFKAAAHRRNLAQVLSNGRFQLLTKTLQASSPPITAPAGARFAAYYSVATNKQEALGLDAQRAAVACHAAGSSCSARKRNEGAGTADNTAIVAC